MEQPPGSLEDLQNQDVSAYIIPGVIDLTRKEGECLHSSPSLDALRRVKGSGWAPNSGASIHALQFPETGSPDVTVRSGDQIQPDNALSHTTVTLSYVSRSHVFSTHNSPVYSVSPVRFSLQPHCNADNRGTGYALNHRYPEREEEAVNPVSRTEPFPSFSQPQLGPEEDAREYCVQEPPECNGGVPSADAYEEEPPGEEEKRSGLPENGDRMEDGQRGGSEASPEVLRADEGGTSDVLLVEIKKRDQADLCSASREYKSPLEDPVSPPATSVGDAEDVFLLPQASSSPSGDGFCPEAADDALPDTLSTGGPPRESVALGDRPARAESSDDSKRSSHRRKAVLQPMTDLPDEPRVSGDPEDRTGGAAPHVNGNANVLERTIKERKLPMRSGRGTRLEAIVMNINSSRYRVSGCILANKKPSASQPPAHQSAFPSSQRKKGRAKPPLSQRTVKRKAAKGNKGKPADAQTHDDSTSLSGLHDSEKAGGSTPAKRPRCARQSRPPRSRPVKSKTKPPTRPDARLPAHHNSKRKPQRLPVPGPSAEIKAPKTPQPLPPAPRSPQTSRGDVKSKSPGSKAPPAQNTKAPRAPRRRRKKPKRGQPSSMFSPKEPEIKLKYASYKEEKKDVRSDSFSPFVRVKRQQPLPALCTIINYAEEGKAQPRKQQQAHSSRFVSAAVPSTSCLRLGRPSKHSRLQRALVCCLCGRSANSVDLGDLHGPYYPEGYRPNPKAPAHESGLKEDEDDSSDSDSSSSILKARRWACGPGAQQGPPGSRRWASGRTGSPAAKRARPDGGLADAEDWYSPPVLPAEPCEYWLHEDCGVWSAGVFLVKGKVYGLEEAVKVAQQTMCSACHNPGATLGCFFKGCPNKYHYRCALESDCVLVEDNFSMKCRKHKNKTLKAPPRSRWHDR
uniref:Si:dkey-94l16.4 n=1 Tax=Fundulus heteroclitus TaxID=8078 RepID=A0A146WXE0_FUNHE